MVATPHRNAWTYHADRSDAERRLFEVEAACQAAGVELRLLLGGEAYIAPDLADQARSGLALTINESRYLLVEWPVDQYPPWSEEAIFSLQIRGICPIVAHAERYRIVQREPERLARLVERGVLVQVTAASLLGKAGAPARHSAEHLVRSGLAHFIASDSHAPAHRPPVLSPARERARELVGDERAWAMVRDAPRQVVDNRAVELPPARAPKTRSLFSFWK
jgi:protein-tyrosine phosphatase